MKHSIKNILACVGCMIVFHAAIAQQNPATLTGTFSEKVNAELQLVDNKGQKLGNYTIYPNSREFVFALPNDTATNYSLQVTIMKQGHIRLEADKGFSIPMTLKPGQNYSLTITPSKLDAAKKTGFSLETGPKNPAVAFVSGKFINWKFGVNVTIQRVIDGEYQSINSTRGANDKSFMVPCVVKQEGFYYLISPRWRLRVYLKPADHLELNIDGMWGSYEVANGSQENQLMQKWQQLISPITKYGYNAFILQRDSFDLSSYLRTYESLEPAITNFRNGINQLDAKFNKLFGMATDVDRELAPVLFLLYSPTTKAHGFTSTPKDFKVVPDFYRRFIQPNKFNDASILNIGEGSLYLDLYTKLVVASLPEEQKNQLSQNEKLGLKMQAITNDTLKSVFLKEQLGTIEVNNLSEFYSTFAPFKKYATTADAKQKYQHVFMQFAGDTVWLGKSSYDFSLPDTSGKMVSMKDFQGKVIVIDVWATWCGPCKGEMPFMKAIEEEYKNNDQIVFMAISLDKAKDKQKWADYIRKENLQGVHLLDDVGMAFGRKYKIDAIPRFMLIDKRGNWIEVRCPRPSDTEALKKYLEEALNQKI